MIPDTYPVSLEIRDHITLACDGDSVDLPNPNIGDANEYVKDVVAQESMNGQLWYKQRESEYNFLHYTFEGLTEANKADLAQFYEDHRGKKITLTDYDSKEWSMAIISETLAFKVMNTTYLDSGEPVHTYMADLQMIAEEPA